MRSGTTKFFRVFFTMLIIISVTYPLFSQDQKKNPLTDLFNLANAAFNRQQYPEAILRYKEFLDLNDFPLYPAESVSSAGKPNFSPEVYKSCLQAAISYEMMDRYDSALWFLQKGMGVLLKSDQPDEKLHVLFSSQIATVYNLQGNFREALEGYKSSLVLAGEWNTVKMDIYQNLGSLYFFREDYENAILHYRKALILAQAIPGLSRTRIIDILTNLGNAWSKKGELTNSISCFTKADSLLGKINPADNQRLAGLDINTGQVLLKLGHPLKAMHRYKTAYEIASRSATAPGNLRITAVEGMAECYSALNRKDSAVTLLREVINQFDSSGKPPDRQLAGIYLVMGDVQSKGNDWEEAISSFNKANSSLIAIPHAGILQEPGRLSEPDVIVLSEIYEHRGAVLLKLAKKLGNDDALLKRSFLDFQSALNLCDSINRELGQELSRMLFHESNKPILVGLLESGLLYDSLSDPGNATELFTIADASRNRILLENLEESRALALAGVPDSLVDARKEVRSEIVYASDIILNPGSFSGRDESTGLLSRITDLKLRMGIMDQQIDKKYKVFNEYARNAKRVTVAEVRNKLMKDEALIEYFHSDSLLFIFLLRTDGFFIKRVLLSPSSGTAIKEFIRLLKGAETEHFQTAAGRVYDLLLQPIENNLKDIRHLIIIPDEELALLPFEALVRDNPGSSDLRPQTSTLHPLSSILHPHYLLNDFGITYHYSAATWLHDTIHPAVNPGDYCFAGFAPGFLTPENNRSSYLPLPESLLEINSIAGLFGKTIPVSTAFLDSMATEKNFREHSPMATHIHIATHSLIDEAEPENSALIFSDYSQDSDSMGRNNGLLHLAELTSLQLKASLVVLSACGTGKGKVTKSEGVLALTRGFYVAGASNILYTLWNIPDRITRRFMISFYQGFLSGKSYSAALRDAKLKMIADPGTSLPCLWAGFVLLGR